MCEDGDTTGRQWVTEGVMGEGMASGAVSASFLPDSYPSHVHYAHVDSLPPTHHLPLARAMLCDCASATRPAPRVSSSIALTWPRVRPSRVCGMVHRNQRPALRGSATLQVQSCTEFPSSSASSPHIPLPTQSLSALLQVSGADTTTKSDESQPDTVYVLLAIDQPKGRSRQWALLQLLEPTCDIGCSNLGTALVCSNRSPARAV